MRRRRAAPEPVDDGDVRVDWERWADGRAYRLKRKRHFADVDPTVVIGAAPAAAASIGKVVQTSKDRYVPERYCWVQFADHEVGPGEPCPCGSRRLLRIHACFARCPECGSQLLLSDTPAAGRNRETRATRILRNLTDVHLALRQPSTTRELYRGYGRDNGELVFLLVELRSQGAVEDDLDEDGEEAEDQSGENELFRRVVSVRAVPFPELAELYGVSSLDLSSLWGGRPPRWDITW